MTAWRKGSGLWRALALASWRMNPAASSLQRPPQKRPSGSDLDGQVLGTSVLWTFARACVLSSLLPGCSLAGEGGNNGGVNGQLASSPRR